jgi:hypothetical protein
MTPGRVAREMTTVQGVAAVDASRRRSLADPPAGEESFHVGKDDGVGPKDLDISREKLSLQVLYPPRREESFHRREDDGGDVDDIGTS